jgi:hypothetical protein
MSNTEQAPVPEEHDPEDASTKPIGRVGQRMQEEVDQPDAELAQVDDQIEEARRGAERDGILPDDEKDDPPYLDPHGGEIHDPDG